MLRTSTRRATRPGLTLVELMVMAAVCVIIMAVLASVFSTGTEAMRQIRSAGEMMDQLRAAGEVMKLDLTGSDPRDPVTHFIADPYPANPAAGDRTRLSDYMFDRRDPPPRGGFFRIVSPPFKPEGPGANGATDSDGLYSYWAPGPLNAAWPTGHQLHFTVVLPATTPPNRYFSATVMYGGGTKSFSSRAAEVAYFLVPEAGRFTNGPAGPGSTSQPLYQLIRRQRLVAMTTADQQDFQNMLIDPTAVSPQDVLSARFIPSKSGGGTWAANDMTWLTLPDNRLGGTPQAPPTPAVPTMTQLGGARIGEDVVLSNVLSFDVKPVWIPGGPVGATYPPTTPPTPPPPQYTFNASLYQPRPFYAPPPATPGTVLNSDNQYDTLPALVAPQSPPPPPNFFNTFNPLFHGQYTFDTWYGIDPATGAPTGWEVQDPNPPGGLNRLPAWFRVKGLQVRLRVFDAKLKNARQSTFVFDM
ncbi:MAG: hypothetical protein K2P78_04025 [Gemmataceae bacterium]|nr:hypothetical protein [Gemmataceae bacterium]